jgi:hypothetical protein
MSVAINEYDKTGRYLVKRESRGFFPWFLRNPRVHFRMWADARRVALPNQGDLTNDLFAILETDAGLEAMCVELESEARADSLPRSLEYVVRYWREPTNPNSAPIICVSGAILDLTGRSPQRELKLKSAASPDCRLEFAVLRRHLADEDANDLLAAVDAGDVSPWQLGWIPLMHGGSKKDIMARWQGLLSRLFAQERDRADLGVIALTFARLAGCRAAWEIALKGWKMQSSPFLDLVGVEVRDQALAQGREEGRAEGIRATLLRQGRRKFKKTPTTKQKEHLEAICELGHLEALAERLLSAKSWGELLKSDSTNGR